VRILVIAFVALTASCALAQDEPQININKMTDAEYKRLNDTRDVMLKAADAYRKAADAYEAAKEDVLGKYGAVESRDTCGKTNRIVDIRGPYIIVEDRPGNVVGTNGSSYNEIYGFDDVSPAMGSLSPQ
jgi:hypothetical protein